MTLLLISRHSSLVRGILQASLIALAGATSTGAEAISPQESSGNQPTGLRVYTQWKTHTIVDGLPSNRIRSVHVVGENVWVGTESGLAAFDGTSFMGWRPEQGLPAYPIEAVSSDPSTGDLWIATFGGGLVRMSGGRFFVFNQINSGLAGDIVFDVEVVGDRVLAATNGGLSVYQPQSERWELCNPRTAEHWSVVTNIAVEKGTLFGLVWKKGVAELIVAENSCRHRCPPWNDFVLPFTEGVAVNAIERGWLISNRVSVRRMRAGVIKEIAPRWLNHNESITAVAEDGLEAVWVGTTKGLHQYAADGENAVTYQFANDGSAIHLHGVSDGGYGLDGAAPRGPIRAIARDGKVIWIGTDGGLVRGSAECGLEEFIRRSSPRLAKDDSTLPTPTTWKGGGRAAIAVYGPRSRTISLPTAGPLREPFRPDLTAVEVAVELENARRAEGNRIRFETRTAASGYARYGWGLPEDDVLVFDRDRLVVGIIGHIPRDDAITDAVAARARLPWINTAPPSQSVESLGAETNPMVFRCFGELPRQHRLLFDFVARRAGAKRVAFVAAGDVVSRRHVGWWIDHAKRQGSVTVTSPAQVALSVEPSPDAAAFVAQRPDVVFAWGDAEFLVSSIRTLREAGLESPVVTGPALFTSDRVPEQVRSELGHVIALLPDPVKEQCPSVHAEFRKTYGERRMPADDRLRDDEAIAGLHAANHLMHAVHMAGADREAVQRVLTLLSQSCYGEDHYEREHAPSTVSIAELRDGEWQVRQISP